MVPVPLYEGCLDCLQGMQESSLSVPTREVAKQGSPRIDREILRTLPRFLKDANDLREMKDPQAGYSAISVSENWDRCGATRQ